MDFGSSIRKLRKERGISLRDLADRVKIDFTYLSKIENGKVDPPSERIIKLVAKELDTDSEELLNLAGKVSSEQIRKAVESNPSVGILLRKLQSRNLTNEQIESMVKIATRDTARKGST
jgi:transcriptional regulator with XRE-family HTH domain